MSDGIFDQKTISQILEKIKKDRTGNLAELMQEIMSISEKAGLGGFTLKELSIMATTGWYLSQDPSLKRFFEELMNIPPFPKPDDDDVWN